MEIKPFSTLRQFIGQIITSYQPVAVKQKSFFVNDVSPDIPLEADTFTLGTLLGSLFYLIGRCSSDAALRVEAATFEDRVVVDITNKCQPNRYNILEKLEHIRMLTRKIGGFLDISWRGAGTMISLTFINCKEPASTPQLETT